MINCGGSKKEIVKKVLLDGGYQEHNRMRKKIPDSKVLE